jgi:predicted MFS family arabinose efflux permease
MVGYYLGGSLGSWLGTYVYHLFGVMGIMIVSCVVLLLAYCYYLITNKLLNGRRLNKSPNVFTHKNENISNF